ncbi:hypothetical protein K8R14_04215 [bacterium]|nr:hypothetical protein [bacterium]
MKISSLFNLNKSQFELDFVDIDIEHDTPLFLDPFLISRRSDSHSQMVNATIKNYFQHLISLIKTGNLNDAKGIFKHLDEPNDTCFGFSHDTPCGNGIGPINQDDILQSIINSKAIESGLVEDLEDTAIFIEGIGKDKVSDMTTQIIRKDLLQYTRDQCNLWDIPLTNNVPSGFFWDITSKSWKQTFTTRLVADNKAFLLIPKYLVSYYKDFIDQQYHQHFILNYLQAEHLENNTSLVHTKKLKSGGITRRVHKKDLKDSEAPLTKEYLRDFTKKHPEIFQYFQERKMATISSLTNSELTKENLSQVVDFLLSELNKITPGQKDANKYHNLMIGILELVFYPDLMNPIKETNIHKGRKRIDIVFDNGADAGFFHRLHDIHKIVSSFILIECKNFSSDLTNPELDQLIGRFGVNRSKFGFLLCRHLGDTKLFTERCKDTWNDKHDLILPLTDVDIKNMLIGIKKDNLTVIQDLLQKKAREIMMS